MAKSSLKRPAAKPASKTSATKSPRVTTAVGQKPGKAASAKLVAGKTAKPTKPANGKSATNGKPIANGKAAAKPVAKAAGSKRLPSDTITVKPAVRAAANAVTGKVARAGVDGKSAATITTKNGATPTANGKTNGGKHTNGSAKPANGAAKPANGSAAAVVAPPAEPKVPGRPMLMQGPVASKALSKKGTFVLPKTPVPAPKPIKRKIERPEPEFVALQPPVPQVRTSDKAVKNRAGLGQKDLEFFRDLLLQKRRELVGDMSHMEREALRESNSNVIVVNVDPTDQGTDAYEQEFTLGLVEKDRTLLREINDAMAKIQNGSYGICEGTGNPISRPRLEAQPWARHSIEFARILEKRKMMFRR